MAGVRGRPRKVQLPEPIAITQEVVKMEAQEANNPLSGIVLETQEAYGRPAVMHPRDVKPTPERMGHVLKKLEVVLARGFTVTPDAEGVSVTISKGRCAESINITSSDNEIMRCVHRVNVASASSSTNVAGV